MSTHIGAPEGAIAPVVLLPGDPMRAKWIAETFLTDATCYNEVRGMYGFTGTWNGRRVSVQGTGMGQPSAAIYITELIEHYGASTLVRVGSCGSMVEDVQIRDVVLASGACTDSAMNRLRFSGLDYAPVADFSLLRAAADAADAMAEVRSHVGLIYSSDSFYPARPELPKRLADYGVLGVEMEASALYTIAAGHGARALAVCTVSDHLVTGAETTSAEREQSFSAMIEIGLSAAFASQHQAPPTFSVSGS
ncbi:purine-nucleoside phosphorylase [Pseudactinotalea sp. HY158]|uniref:purine-nucleoside phosphorylase n=1 Tax=Pseudactinotalea sp. HY158 TaxID=2654547 RepID=UPI00129CF9EF|nr:purine-nucleoside phosphorylase [Pseudactinotalea sp. HY158]QGH68257.1 purine-nucleoside phosphorylase [Pseudactinotalea sp. HY158]